MIIDNIKNIDTYKFSKNVLEAFDFCVNAKGKEEGTYELSNGMFAMVQVYNTKLLSACVLEGHEKYIDLQYMIDGEEKMGYLNREKAGKPVTEYMTGDDAQLFEGDGEYTSFKEGDFSFFFPQDLHAARCAIDDKIAPIVKVVVKIPKEQF